MESESSIESSQLGVTSEEIDTFSSSEEEGVDKEGGKKKSNLTLFIIISVLVVFFIIVIATVLGAVYFFLPEIRNLDKIDIPFTSFRIVKSTQKQRTASYDTFKGLYYDGWYTRVRYQFGPVFIPEYANDRTGGFNNFFVGVFPRKSCYERFLADTPTTEFWDNQIVSNAEKIMSGGFLGRCKQSKYSDLKGFDREKLIAHLVLLDLDDHLFDPKKDEIMDGICEYISKSFGVVEVYAGEIEYSSTETSGPYNVGLFIILENEDIMEIYDNDEHHTKVRKEFVGPYLSQEEGSCPRVLAVDVRGIFDEEG